MRIDAALLQQCWFLAGPTACGKTSVSLQLAERIGAEILALDSMTLYRGMNIGTAKASADEQLRVPHHLIDIIDPREEFSVAQYVAAAEGVCRDVIARGRIPLFVGGTGLYLRGILRGVFAGPPADWTFRRRMEELSQQQPERLHARLQEVDPPSSQRLHPNDLRRIIRALEIYEATGQPASELQQEAPLPESERPANVFWISPPRDWLYDRIDARVDQMIADGLLAEVAGLMESPQPLSRTARQALGYRELIDHLEGKSTLDEAIAQIQMSTRQFAKRQHTWFRNLVECRDIPMTGTESTDDLVERIVIASDDPARPAAT